MPKSGHLPSTPGRRSKLQTSRRSSSRRTPPVMGLEHSYAHLSLQEARETFEQGYIKEVLTKTVGNITHASKMAGIAWQNFHQKLKKYEINAKSFAKEKT
ncbi:MAG: hypothetical protein CME25_18860 [Gemmatimonadetes bacterium]|nr:hypothetical protein [Gemmatimonadota bacterium]